jgi:hypothetical protein
MNQMVYVVQESPGKNVLPAGEYGELKVLLPPGQVVLSPGPTLARLRKNLNAFSDNDYLLMIGDPVAIALAAMVASDINGGRVKMLKWDRRENRYFPVTANIHSYKEV